MADSSLPFSADDVVLMLTDAGEHEVVVTKCDGSVVTVLAPTLRPEEMLALDDQVSLLWASARGRHEAVVQLFAMSSAGRPEWELALVGDIASWQERRYVRGGGGEPIAITRTAIEAPALTGTIVDLAERSVRAKLTVPAAPTDAEDGGLPSPAVLRLREGVAVTLRIGATPLSVPGRVYRVSEVPGNGPADRVVDTVVLLDVTDRQADTLRRYIFESQRTARSRPR